MRRFLTLTLSAVLFTLLLSGCFVHEWPNPPSKVALHLSLEYDTDMDTTETIYGTRSQTSLTQSDIRYIIRAYPITKGGKAAQDFTDEFIFTAVSLWSFRKAHTASWCGATWWMTAAAMTGTTTPRISLP